MVKKNNKSEENQNSPHSQNLLNNVTVGRDMTVGNITQIILNLIPKIPRPFMIIFLSTLGVISVPAILNRIWVYHPEVFSSANITVEVPGKFNPWLAGMPPGSSAGECRSRVYAGTNQYISDTRPETFPKQVNLPLKPGRFVTFTAEEGLVAMGGDRLGPEGKADSIVTLEQDQYEPGGVNGIASVTAPARSLVGVFLGADQPDKDSAPSARSFADPNSRNNPVLKPKVKQVFFIGDGRTDKGIKQKVFVPEGATRLFLGTMDNCFWTDNGGSFNVNVAISRW